MSFAFRQVDPETSGLGNIPIPLDQYLSASFEQGWHDSAFDSLNRIDEVHAANMDNSPMISPDQANQQYGVGDLKFNQPVKQSVAQILNQRKKDEMDRNYFLSQGASKARFIPGMAASLVGGMSNPLDLGLAFVPWVGEEKVAAATLKAGGSSFRYAMARGLVQTDAPRLVQSTLNGTGFMIADQIPHLIAAKQDQEDFTSRDAVINALATAGLGTALHFSLRSAGLLMDGLERGTKEQMARDAVEQFLKDESPNVAKYVNVDENAIRQKIAFNEDDARAKAENNVSTKDVARVIQEKYQESPVAAAYQLNDGKLVTGASHNTVLWKMESEGIPVDSIKDEGFVTDKGRFVSRNETSNLLGHVGSSYDHLQLEAHGHLRAGNISAVNPEHLSVEEHTYFQNLVEGGATRLEAMQMVRDIHLQKHDAAFFAQPEVQNRIAEERRTQVDALVQRAKQENEARFTQMRQAEIERQQREGRILPPEEIQKYTNPENFNDVTEGNLDRDIATLEENLSLENKGGPSENLSPEQQVIEKRNKDQMREEFAKELERINKESKPEVKSIRAASDCILEQLI